MHECYNLDETTSHRMSCRIQTSWVMLQRAYIQPEYEYEINIQLLRASIQRERN